MARDRYERTISGEEAREGYLFVSKDALAFFPPVGEAFELGAEPVPRTVALETRDCQCRGPEKPHRHWFIRWHGLKAGERIAVWREGEVYRVQRH